jgi:hypothetical protein
MQDTVEHWLGKPRTVVHLLCDDPSYIGYYHEKYRSQRQLSPPRVTLGLHWDSPPTDMSASVGHMEAPRAVRLTSLEHFMEDVLLMTMSDVFYSTTGSTVTGVVQWYRKALGLAPHWQGSLGNWAEHDSASKQAYESAKQLLRQVQTSSFDPESLRMLHDQRAELRKLGPPQLRALHAALIDHVKNRVGKPISQTLTEDWYHKNPLLRENRQAYKRCWESHRKQGDSRPHMHWFKAVLTHRLNEWLRESRQAFIWGFDNQSVWQMDLAYPSALEDLPEEAAPMLDATALLADAGTVDLTGGSAKQSVTLHEDPPAKRARVEASLYTGLKCKAGFPTMGSSSSASGLTSVDRARESSVAVPKPMPRSGVAKAKAAPGGP